MPSESVQVYVVDAFTRSGQGGNPAGVVLNTQGLTVEQMQEVATTVGLSETAFVLPSMVAEHRLRYFTPRAEVALCGHATIASYHLLRERGGLQHGHYELQTEAGQQVVRCGADGTIAMTQNLPTLGSTLPVDEVAAALGVSVRDVGPKALLPAQVASTGLHKIFVPLISMEAVDALCPHRDAVERLSVAHGAIGIYAYTTASEVTAHCRNFAPVVGIWDDAATGTSAGALACVLQERGVLDSQSTADLIFHQGDAMERPSEIRVALSRQGRRVAGIEVLGQATTRRRVAVELSADGR